MVLIVSNVLELYDAKIKKSQFVKKILVPFFLIFVSCSPKNEIKF